MSAPGSRTKRSSSPVSGLPRSLSIACRIMRSLSFNFWRTARRSGVSAGDGSCGLNMAINAAAVSKLLLPTSVLFFPCQDDPALAMRRRCRRQAPAGAAVWTAAKIARSRLPAATPEAESRQRPS
jgi:hypothetical protein